MVAGKSKIFMVGQKADPGKNQCASQSVGRIPCCSFVLSSASSWIFFTVILKILSLLFTLCKQHIHFCPAPQSLSSSFSATLPHFPLFSYLSLIISIVSVTLSSKSHFYSSFDAQMTTLPTGFRPLKKRTRSNFSAHLFILQCQL